GHVHLVAEGIELLGPVHGDHGHRTVHLDQELVCGLEGHLLSRVWSSVREAGWQLVQGLGSIRSPWGMSTTTLSSAFRTAPIVSEIADQAIQLGRMLAEVS